MNENDYLVKGQKSIKEYLSVMFKKKCILSAYFGEHNLSFLTAILEIDLTNNVLKIDSAPSELLNKQLLSAPRVLFRTQVDGIKASFSGKDIKKTKIEDHPCFEMPIPTALFWMQRRQYYRIKVPLNHSNSICKLSLPVASETEEIVFETFTFRLGDISIKGFTFFNPVADLYDEFEVEKSFSNCQFFLHESSHTEVGFIIKNMSMVKLNANQNQQRIGCSFKDLSPHFESIIQRYMQEIEIQTKNTD